ncbi:MAG: META domain-containing protein [Rhizobiaceae bacterium]
MPLIVSRRAIARAGLIAAIAATQGLAPAEEMPDEGPSGDLFDIVWQVTELAGADPIAAHVPTLTINLAGSAGGNTGCNVYFATATVDGASISFSAIGSTYIACDDAIMDQERAFLQALGLTTQFEVNAGGLLLLDRAGALLVRLAATS